jgi:hypothetical protein
MGSGIALGSSFFINHRMRKDSHGPRRRNPFRFNLKYTAGPWKKEILRGCRFFVIAAEGFKTVDCGYN